LFQSCTKLIIVSVIRLATIHLNDIVWVARLQGLKVIIIFYGIHLFVTHAHGEPAT